MLINIENATEENVLDSKFTTAIENILRAFAERKHLIIAQKKFFNCIMEEKGGIYSMTSKNFASEALAGLIEYHAILNQVSFYISVDFTIHDTSFRWIDLGEKYKFICGPLYFNDS
ncbi:TPA: hypothetical protein ACGHSL_004730, partial [Salmonella enterica subsp. enterica serovar Bareilly]|nr:hypothetical protein [Salmonella enterica]